MTSFNPGQFSPIKPLSLIYLFFWLCSFGVYGADPDCEVIRYITLCQIDGDKLTRTDSVVIQINNRSGEEVTHVAIPYSGTRKISNLNGWIEDVSGNVIRTLRNQDITNVSAISDFSLYEDDYIRKFTLKHNVYPYRIRYTFTTVSRQFLMIADWDPVMKLDIPTRHASLTLIFPQDYQINIYENAIKPAESLTVGKTEIRSWYSSYDGSLDVEIFSPAMEEWIPNVKIVPRSFDYGIKGRSDSWESYGYWLCRLMEGLDVLPETETSRVQNLISACRDKQEVIRVLYHYLQDNTHYVNVSIDIGGMKPFPANYVSFNKYGDCKALTNYLMALLASAGIKSYYTIVYRDEQPLELIQSLPGPQFNHVLLTVPLDNDTIWLESTDNSNPFGYLGITNQNREALVIDGEKSHIIRLPAMSVHDVKETGKSEYFLSKNGKTEGTMGYTYKGYDFELANAILSQLNPEQQNAYLHEHMPIEGSTLTKGQFIKANRDDPKTRLVASFTLDNVIKSTGQEYYFSIQTLDLPNFTNPKQRKLPVQLSYPLACQDTLIYHLPAGIYRVNLPENTFHQSKYGDYEAVFKQNGNEVALYRNFVLYAGRYPLSEYADLYAFLTAIKNYEKRKILIQ